jgi:hypothetical protein
MHLEDAQRRGLEFEPETKSRTPLQDKMAPPAQNKSGRANKSLFYGRRNRVLAVSDMKDTVGLDDFLENGDGDSEE